jgi:phosphopantothenoylcysteine decarboxylase/phosphopantothenate--cysteine ligase
MLAGKKILLGVTGSIAAYKSAMLVRALIKEGAEVRVVMTKSATDFITPLTLSTLSKNAVQIDFFSEGGWNNHVELGLWADLLLVAPCTAQTMAKFALGLCEDMLSACYLSARCPVWIAPAMDVDMWKHSATRRNLDQLQKDGVQIIPVDRGELASGLVGEGRMAEPESITNRVIGLFQKKKQLHNLRALVTAGPTYEDIDPVRYIGNRSTGKMGIATAMALVQRGIQVDLILGPSTIAVQETKQCIVHRVRSAAEMATVAFSIWPSCQIAVLAAAVADYTPAVKSEQKLKKKAGPMHIELSRTTDIAARLGTEKTSKQISVGFALETNSAQQNALRKLASKNFDFIVLNSLKDAGAGFQYDTNKVTFLFSTQSMDFPLKQKTEIAEDIVDQIEKIALNKKLI